MNRGESKIRTELERLAKENGGELRPEVVVLAAAEPSSPLHDSFEWNDTEAAEKWRLHQARNLIRAVVTYEQIGGQKVACRVFASLTTDRKEDGAGYRLVATVVSDEEMKEQLFADALAEMQVFQAKYQRLQELAEVFRAMRAAETKAIANRKTESAAAA